MARSNQAIEVANKNKLIKDITKGRAVRGVDWLELSRKLEKRTFLRLEQIKEKAKFLKKHKQSEDITTDDPPLFFEYFEN